MKHPKVILLAGKARSGKNYVARKCMEILKEKGYTVDCGAFADDLKLFTAITLGITLEELDRLKNSSEPFLKNGSTVRECIQRLGTDVFRGTIDPDIWNKRLAKKIYEANVDFYFVTDSRFKNDTEEWRFLDRYEDDKVEYRNYDCINVWVNGGDKDVIKEGDHISEHLLDDFKFDYYIDNRIHKPDLKAFINFIENFEVDYD